MRKITGLLLQPEQTLFCVQCSQSEQKAREIDGKGRLVCGERRARVHNWLFIVWGALWAVHKQMGPVWPMAVQYSEAGSNERADKSDSVWLWTMLFLNLDIDTSRIAIVSAPPRPIVLSFLPPPPRLEPIHRKQRSKDWSQAAPSELLYCLF